MFPRERGQLTLQERGAIVGFNEGQLFILEISEKMG